MVMVDTRIERKFPPACRRGGRMRYRHTAAKVDAHLTVQPLIGHHILYRLVAKIAALHAIRTYRSKFRNFRSVVAVRLHSLRLGCF